ncbi:EF-hand domain-containing protein [Sphingomonas sp.]|uniref:EF-hand domain-containing protein n=1 Tax=Sphingomonas sp. TaxID=28214 RepID=UPI002B7E3DF8|nr:EF-hand domain-containing protein [Sphingomonas sp.]HWK36224.1 EF-hand domain-containing protein [Sphingomonas sp.]
MPIVVALLLAAQQAPATNGAPQPYRPPSATIVAEPVSVMLAGFDADGDGRITEAEASAGVARSFAAIANGADDIGFIAFADWAERWLGDRNAVPSPFEIDRNGDGRITLPELADRISAIFARLDSDKDHVLTHRELLTIRSSAIGGERGGPDGPGAPKGRGGRRR